MVLNSCISTRYLGGKLTFIQAAGVYFGSQAPKYLPGGIWSMPSRMMFYKAKGMSGTHGVLSVLREVAALFLGAATVGFVASEWILDIYIPVSCVAKIITGLYSG